MTFFFVEFRLRVRENCFTERIQPILAERREDLEGLQSRLSVLNKRPGRKEIFVLLDCRIIEITIIAFV